MKTKITLLLAGFWPVLLSFQLSAQSVTNYAFSASTGTFTALSGATSPALTTGTSDNGSFTALPIGFDFWYMGARYTTVSASTNGWLSLGSTITDDNVNGLTARGTRPLISPLWDDLDIVTASNFSYLTTGTAGSRVFTIQYLNVKWNAQATGSVISFQVNLYESTGKVEFVYRTESTAALSPSASVGITAAATGSGNFLSVNNAGNAASSSSEANVNSKPGSLKTYDFTPPVPTAPSGLTFSSVSASSMTVNWTDNSSNEAGFVLYRSTDGINYSFVSQTAANATSSVQSGLTANTSYYWKVYAVSEGGLSAALPGTRATACGVIPAPTVSTPVNYCQNATAAPLTATGSNLVWGSGAVSGSVGGTTALTSTVYIDNSYNNRKTNFTTTTASVTITTVDYYIPSWQAVAGIVLAIYNSAGTVIATSSTSTTTTSLATATKITNTFNYTIAAAGNYSIGVSSGLGNIGYDNPSFPLTESSGTVTITGTSAGYRCFTNIQFTANNGAVAPTPLTTVAGTTNYLVSQTISGCVSPQATIAVIVTATPSATISYTGTPYCISAGSQSVTRTGTGGGTYSAAPGLTIDASTGAINPSASTAGVYTVTYTIAAAGGCGIYTTTTPVTITAAPVATFSYSGSPFCTSTGGTAAPAFSGTSGGTYTAPAGLVINATTGVVNLSTSVPGTYTVTYSVAAAGGCAVYTTTAGITINASPAISQLPATGLVAYYKFNGNANDATGNDNGTLQNSPVSTADRFGVAGSAYMMNGTSNYVSTANQYTNPTNFTISIWFKTSTVTGGKLIGFGAAQTGLNYQFDRHIYMNNAGQLYFGIYSGGVITVNSALSYNDNNWHLATASLSSTAGMALYVDGIPVGSNASATTAENSSGYWRMGYDNLGGWTSAPSSLYFSGVLDDASIYSRALTASEIAILYGSPDGAGNNGPVCTGSSVSLTATPVPGAAYAWTGPNGFSAASANPSFTYSTAAAGSYTLQVTAAGCVATAYTNVISSAVAGQWTGSVSTDWANAGNWCSGTLPTAATNVSIGAGAPYMPAITTAVSCNNLTINAGATLTIAAAGTLNIAGILANTGVFTNGGTVNFNGTTGQQTFSGVSQFYNLAITNTAGLLLPAAITANNNLTINAGFLNANDFNLTVKGNWMNNAATTAFAAGAGGVTLNGAAAQSIGGTFATTFNNLTISDTGSTVTLLVNTSVTGNLSVAAGTFDLAAFTANRASSGGVLSVSNNATLRIGGTNTFPANYATNTLVVGGTVEYAGANQNVASQAYGNLKLSSSGGAAVKTLPATAMTVTGNLSATAAAGASVVFTAEAPVTVNGNITIGASATFNGGSYTHSFGGNWTDSGVFNGNAGTVIFTGAGSSVGGPGAQNFNNLTVAAPLVSFSSAAISLSGNLATSGSGSFNQASGGSLTMTGTGATISGAGISPGDLIISGSVSTATSLTITGNLSVSGSFTSSGGVLTMSGAAKTLSGAGNKTFSILSVTGSLTTTADFSISSGLTVSGSLTASAGTATFTGATTLSGTANLFNTTVTGTSLQLSASSVLGVAGVLTTTAPLDVTSAIPNTVNFNSSSAQNINAITYDMLTLSNGNTKTAAGALTINNTITIAAGTTFNPGTFTHSIYNNWINNGSFTAGASTIQLSGNANSNISGATTFNILTINKATAGTEIIQESNISAAIVNMINGTITTGSDTITITTTRTGNGKILGNIRRTHPFTTGIPYAFENPDNSITFSSVSSVTSITVSITEDVIDDFPFGGSINEEYDIAVPAGTYSATLRLDYDADELNGNNRSSLTLWKYTGSSWIDIGATAGDTTAGYEEQSGLTNISGRWTLSDATNIVQWNGSVSTDWFTAANWTATQGAPSTPPSATDIVNLGTAPFTYQPTINNSALAKNIHFGSAQTVILTLAGGGSLTTSGNIDGDWTADAVHIINVNDQTLTVNGHMNLSDGINGRSITLNIGAGAVNISGPLFESADAGIHFSGAGTLQIGNDFNYSSGLFSPGNGTVIYNGSVNQDIAKVTYNNLTVNKTGGLADMDDTVIVLGNLLIAAGELDNYSTVVISGNVTIDPGAIFQNNHSLYAGGNWVNSGAYVPLGGSSAVFNGAGAQIISASPFGDLTINKPSGTATLTGNLTVSGNTSVLSGTLDFKTYSIFRTIAGGSSNVANGATVIVDSANGFAGFSTYTLGPASTFIFNNTAPISFPGGYNGIFGNLILRNTGAKTLSAPATVNGDLTIDSGATFDASAYTLTLNGNWINNGTFIPSTSAVLCTGAAKNISGNTTFNKLTVLGSYTILNDVIFNDLLTITPTGSLSGGVTIHTTLNGDLLNSGVLYTLGTTTFSGNVVQTLSLINAVTTVALTVNFNGSVSPVLNSTSAPQFGYLNINNTGGVNPSVGWTILYALTVGAGAAFNGGPSTHIIYGAVTNNGTITSNGSLIFAPASATAINLGSNFSSTGEVIFGGAGAMTLSGTSTAFNDVEITNTNVAGITPVSDWNVAGTFTINPNAVFNAGSHTYTVGSDLLNNGTLNSGTSTFILNGSADQDISSGPAFNNLTINKTAGAGNLLTNITINGVLNFVRGNISTNDYQVVLPATGSVNGAGQYTGWVDGKLNKNIATGAALQTYEIGDATSYVPVALAFSNVSTAGGMTASTTAGEHPAISSSAINPAKSVNRYWTLSDSGVVFDHYAATFNFTAADVDAGATTSSFGVGLYNGSSWVLPAIANPAAIHIQATGITATGDFAIGDVCNAGTTIRYTGSPFCSNTSTASPTLTGSGGGAFSSATGLVIDGSTGIADPATSVAGPYTVLYSVAASGGCPEYVTSAAITIIAAPSATISYAGSPYCSGAGTASVTLSGTAGGAFSSGAGLTIDTATGDITLSTSTAGKYSVSYTLSGCAPDTAIATVTITPAGAWTGITNSDWNNGGNWSCGAIPGSATDVVIPSGVSNYPLISNGTGAVHHLTIQTGASLTVSGGTLQIAGDISNNGTFMAGSGAIEMNGVVEQTIPVATFSGNTVNNLTINNASGVSLQGTLYCTGILLAANGTLNTGGYLTLVSTATQTASVDGSGDGEITGNVTMQRYVVSGFGYKYISSPFIADTVGDYAGEVDLTASFPAFYRNDESLSTSGWVNYTDPSGQLIPMVGYAANLGSSAAARTIEVRGVLNNHTISSPLLYNHDMTYTGGFNLVGNPYPSPVNWNSPTGWTKTNIDNAVYYFNAGSSDQYTGVYSSYINGVSSDGIAGSTIPAMQGFFVHVSDGTFPVTGQLTVNNNARILNPTVIFYGLPEPQSPPALLRLTAGFADETIAADPAVFYFPGEATGIFDKKLDALKLMNTDPLIPNLYAVSKHSEKLSIEALPAFYDSLSVPLGLITKKEGWITFKARDMQDMPVSRHIYLYDLATGVSRDLETDPPYRLYLPAGEYANRFFLQFSAKELVSANPAPGDDFRAYSAGGNLFVDAGLASGEKGNLVVINLLGQVVYRQEISGSGYQQIHSNFTPGIYLVNLSTAKRTHVKKIFIGHL